MIEQYFIIGMLIAWYLSIGLTIRFLANKMQACDTKASIGFILLWPLFAPFVCIIVSIIDEAFDND